jgi:hypothetical protein
MVAKHSAINVHGSAQDATLIFAKQKFQEMYCIVGKRQKLSNKLNQLLGGKAETGVCMQTTNLNDAVAQYRQ